MNQIEYITRTLARTQKKRFENYVVTRIYHLLNDLSIKIITQQYVSRPENKRALTDMYFPQFGLHIEVDEPYHLSQKEQDQIRELDVVNATKGHQFRRVDISKGLENVHEQIDAIVQEVKRLKNSDLDFKPWIPEKEYDPETYIIKGTISIDDNCAFLRMTDAASCFGKKFKDKSIWTGGINHPIEENVVIWFPKLYENGDWNNSISDDENIITEKSKNNELTERHTEKIINLPYHRRIVFARVKSPLGDVMYRFRGVYELDREKTSINSGLIWNRISKIVQTYSPS